MTKTPSCPRVLDAGCGSGNVTLIAAELVEASGHVVGIDRSEAAVDAARERAWAAGAAHASFEVRDIDDPPDGPFDAVVGRRVLMYHPAPVRAIRGLAAKLRPGGIVAFHEHANVEPMAGDGLALHRTVQGWLRETVRREGGNTGMGAELEAAPHVSAMATRASSPDEAKRSTIVRSMASSPP